MALQVSWSVGEGPGRNRGVEFGFWEQAPGAGCCYMTSAYGLACGYAGVPAVGLLLPAYRPCP